MITTVYDAAQRAIASIDQLGYRTTTLFDAANRALSTTDALGFSSTLVYDAAGQQIATVDPLGYRTTTLFDAAGQAFAEIDALGQRTTAVYDVSGTVVARVDALGNSTTTVFDSAGRVIRRVNAMGGMQTNVYDGFGRAVGNVDPRGYVTSSVYDGFGRAVGYWDPLGYLTTRTFDSFGRCVGSMDPAGYQTTMVFDLLDRPAVQIDALGYRTTTFYDTAGRAYASVDGLGRRLTTAFDAASRTAAQINALGYATSFSYDLRGSETGTTNPRGFQTTIVLDALARPLARVDALGRRTTMGYDARGLMAQQTDAKAQIETRTYDALARCTGSQYADGTRVTTVYDALGQIVQQSNQLGVWTRTYDALQRTVSENAPSQPSGWPLTSLYDPSGNRIALVTWRGTETATYDARNQMVVLADIEAGLSTWTYEGRKLMTRQQNPNGTNTNISYDGAGRALSILHTQRNGNWLDSALYTYDPAGNPLSLDRQDGDPYSYRYDYANQILVQSSPNEGTKTWTYDPAGNRTTEQSNPGTSIPAISYWTTCTFDAADQQLTEQKTGSGIGSSSTSTFSYDLNGNRILETKISGAVTSFATYSWDPSNRLAVIQDGSYVMTNTYRPDGMRHRKVDSNLTMQMVWDKNDTLAWVDQTGALGEFFSRGAKAVKGYSSPSPTGELFYHCTALGTMQAYSNPDGTTKERAVLDAWGGNATAMGFDAYSFVGDAGYWGENAMSRPLYYVRARWLIAGGPGWLSPDPAADQLLRLYHYVESCPTRLVDPTGLVLKVVIGFDDSPRSGLGVGSDADSTAAIRGELQMQGIKAAFFVIGQRFDKRTPDMQYPWTFFRSGPNPGNNPDPAITELRHLVDGGHAIGNHTYCHESTWWPKPRAFPDGHQQTNAHPCDDVATCGPTWQTEICRTQLLVLDLTHRWMTEYRPPGLNWNSQVEGPIHQVLVPYVYRGDNSVDANIGRTVRTLHDEIEIKTVTVNGVVGKIARSPDWLNILGQIEGFLFKAHPNDQVYIFFHDQPTHGSADSDDQPRGLVLLQKIVAYLRDRQTKRHDVMIIDAPTGGKPQVSRCPGRLLEVFQTANPTPGEAKARGTLISDCPKLG